MQHQLAGGHQAIVLELHGLVHDLADALDLLLEDIIRLGHDFRGRHACTGKIQDEVLNVTHLIFVGFPR